VGKTATALTVAKALNCQNLKEDSCDRCHSCRLVDRGQHPNVRFITREKNREQIVKDQVDEINYLAHLRPWQGGRLVFIIDQAERMNETAANSLLKTLEEPGASVYFILITEDLSAILPTIRSRCQVLKFKRISQEDLERALETRGLPPDRAGLIASTTDGNLELALNLSWEDFITSRNRAWLLFTRLLEKGEAEDFMNLVSGGARKDSLDNFKEIPSFFSVFFRDLLAVKKGQAASVLNSDLKSELEGLARKVSEDRAAEGIKQMEGYLGSLKKNPNLGIISNEIVIFSGILTMADVVLLLSESTGKIIRGKLIQEPVEIGDYCLVESEYGGDLAMVIDTGSELVQCPKAAKEAVKIIRRATPEDIDKFKWLREKEKQAFEFCLQRIKYHNLPMKLVAVRYFSIERRGFSTTQPMVELTSDSWSKIWLKNSR